MQLARLHVLVKDMSDVQVSEVAVGDLSRVKRLDGEAGANNDVGRGLQKCCVGKSLTMAVIVV